MAKENDYMKINFDVLHRKSCLDRSIYDWITSARYHIPSLSIIDCAKSFLAYHKIDEGELSIEKIKKTFIRIQSEIFEDSKTKHHG
jgi:hypothetical protein